MHSWLTNADVGTMCDDAGNGCTGYLAWAVAVGAISLGIGIIMTILMLCGSTKGIADQATPFVAVLLFLLWAAGVAILTFKAPFTSACSYGHYYGSVGSSANGYFASWVCFIAACMYLYATFPQVQQLVPADHGEHLLPGLLVTSCIVTAQAAYDGLGTDVRIWALCAGAISGVLVLMLLLITQLSAHMKYFALALALLWGCAVATLTFVYSGNNDMGIWASAGNGFFATWAAFFMSFVLCYTTWVGHDAMDSKGDHSQPILP